MRGAKGVTSPSDGVDGTDGAGARTQKLEVRERPVFMFLNSINHQPAPPHTRLFTDNRKVAQVKQVSTFVSLDKSVM